MRWRPGQADRPTGTQATGQEGPPPLTLSPGALAVLVCRSLSFHVCSSDSSQGVDSRPIQAGDGSSALSCPAGSRLVSLGECPPSAVSGGLCAGGFARVGPANTGPLVGRARDVVLASPRHTRVFSFPVPQLQCVPPLWLLLLTVGSGCCLSSSGCSRTASPLQQGSPRPRLCSSILCSPNGYTCPVSGLQRVTLSYPHFACSS